MKVSAARRIDKRKRLRRAGLHQHAAERLRSLIIRGQLAPGEQLAEAELAESLGVSRTPLRDALKLLATEGLVELRPNRSAIVAPLRREDIEELFEAVGGIERLAAELAAVRMSERDLQKLERLQVRMEAHHDRGELRDYFELNQQIHVSIVAGAKNRALLAAHVGLLARVERARFFALSSQARWDESVDEHRHVLAALQRRDSRTAGDLLEHHVRRTGTAVGQLLDAFQPRSDGRADTAALAAAK